jgi:hypothetical protein
MTEYEIYTFRDVTLFLFGVRFKGGVKTAEALTTTGKLRKGCVLKNSAGERFRLLEGLKIPNFLLCLDLTVKNTEPFEVLEAA